MAYRIDDLEILPANPFLNDALERRPIVEFLSDLIKRLDGPFVLALDSPWGSGKTTLIRMLMADLDKKGVQCTYFNAWKVDYVTDPLVAMVSSIDRIDLGMDEASGSYREHLKTVKKLTSLLAKRGLRVATKAVTLGALDLDKEIEAATAEFAADGVGDIVDAFNHEIELLEKFRAELAAAVKQLPAAGREPNLVFFIDELDRCRPTFAIELLERIKHLFDIPNIIFVLSIDKQQLEASTAAVYGAGINAAEYLRRFIDLEYGVPVADSTRFTENLIERFGLDTEFGKRKSSAAIRDKRDFVSSFTLLADAMSLSLRARERCFTRLKIVMDQTPDDDHLDPLLVAILIVLRSNKADLFRRMVSGEADAEEVMGFLTSLPSGAKFKSGRPGSLIHAYLLLLNPDREQILARLARLQMIANDLNTDDDERLPAVHIVDALDNIFLTREINSLATVVAKIDLAARVAE